MNKSETIGAIAKALADFQSEIKNPKQTAVNPYYKSKYAPLAEILDDCRPVLVKNGISVIQSNGGDGESITVTTLLLHSSGEWIESDPLPIKKDKMTPQDAGGAITYGRRYQLSSMLGIASEDDDDGNKISDTQKSNRSPASPSESSGNPTTPAKQDKGQESRGNTISEAQQKRLYALCSGRNEIGKEVIAEFGYDSSKNVLVKDYDAICEKINVLVVRAEYEDDMLKGE
jgi:hypothetical protein